VTQLVVQEKNLGSFGLLTPSPLMARDVFVGDGKGFKSSTTTDVTEVFKSEGGASSMFSTTTTNSS
jgi:hypothetical protein